MSTMTAFDRITDAAVQPDPGDSLIYEECLAMQGPVPEIQVTHEMRAAARRVVAGHHPASSLREASERAALIDDVYRAMAAVAPGGTKMWAEYLAAMQRVTEMESQRDELVNRLAKAQAENAELKSGNAALCEHLNILDGEIAALTGSDPAPVDLPNPPRRADGTLAPPPKPWTPPKDAGGRSLIGG